MFFYLLFIKAYGVCTQLNCLDKSTYAFILFEAIQMSTNNICFLSHLLVAGCDIGIPFSVRPTVSPSVRLSTFMSTFDIYVKVSILINYKTKQPSNLA